jgi:hypothetical protein
VTPVRGLYFLIEIQIFRNSVMTVNRPANSMVNATSSLGPTITGSLLEEMNKWKCDIPASESVYTRNSVGT